MSIGCGCNSKVDSSPDLASWCHPVDSHIGSLVLLSPIHIPDMTRTRYCSLVVPLYKNSKRLSEGVLQYVLLPWLMRSSNYCLALILASPRSKSFEAFFCILCFITTMYRQYTRCKCLFKKNLTSRITPRYLIFWAVYNYFACEIPSCNSVYFLYWKKNSIGFCSELIYFRGKRFRHLRHFLIRRQRKNFLKYKKNIKIKLRKDLSYERHKCCYGLVYSTPYTVSPFF